MLALTKIKFIIITLAILTQLPLMAMVLHSGIKQNNKTLNYPLYYKAHQLLRLSKLEEERICQNLTKAIVDGNLEKVKQIIKNGCDLNYRSNNYAATRSYLNIAIDAAKFSLKIDDRQLKILELLLQAGANVNTKDFFNMSALEHALFRNSETEVIKLLLYYGADIYYKNLSGLTMLELSKQKSSKVNNLLESYHNLLQKVKTNPDKDTLREAIKHDYYLIVKDLIKLGISVDIEDLNFAKQYNSKLSGKILLDELKLIHSLELCGLPAEIADYIAKLSH